MRSLARSLMLAYVPCVLALAMTAASSASAARPEIVKKGGGAAAGVTFTFTSKESLLVDEGGGVLACKSDKGSGEIKAPKELALTIDFEGCQIKKMNTQSLGDKAGVILLSVPGELCYINLTTKDVGVLFTLPASDGLHIETPATGELERLTGSVVALMTPVNTLGKAYTMTFNNPNEKGVGSAGKEDELLLEKEHSGKLLKATEIGAESLTFAEEVEILA